jgi:hypothetical protein
MSASRFETNKPTSLKDGLERKSKIFIEKKLLEDRMNQLIQEGKDIDKYLWDVCDHIWIRDYSSCDDDLCKRYCTICNLRHMKMLYN